MQLFPGTVRALPAFRSSMRRATSSSHASLHGLIRRLEAVEQRVRQSSALIHRKRERPFQKIGNLWTHCLVLLPLSVPHQYRPSTQKLSQKHPLRQFGNGWDFPSPRSVLTSTFSTAKNPFSVTNNLYREIRRVQNRKYALRVLQRVPHRPAIARLEAAAKSLLWNICQQVLSSQYFTRRPRYH